jgi:hypothetical protein
MRKYLDRQILRLWMWLVTVGDRRATSAVCHLNLKPGDEERLLEALIGMNNVLARAAR